VKTKSDWGSEKQQGLKTGLAGGERHNSSNQPDFSSPLHPNAEKTGKHGPSEGEVPQKTTSPVFTSSPSEPPFLLTLGPAQYEFRRWVPALGRVISGPFALDTETERIDEKRPDRVPALVLGSAFDGKQGFFILAEDMPAFLAAHPANPLIFHNAAFDLAVLQRRLGLDSDIYARVESGRVADTMILARLLPLGTVGHSARNQCSLEYCAGHYLNLPLPKDAKNSSGQLVRETFGNYLHRPLEAFPDIYLQYAAGDPVATWLLFQRLKNRLADIRINARPAYGYAGERWLEDQWKKHGPGTHHIQLKGSIALDRISRTGVLINRAAATRRWPPSNRSSPRPVIRSRWPAYPLRAPARRPRSRSEFRDWPTSTNGRAKRCR